MSQDAYRSSAMNSFLSRYSDLAVAAGVLLILAVMVIPLPTPLLDFLLTLDITIALTLLLLTLYIRRPMDFSVFPTLLLLVTLLRLSLNVASTRIILLNAYAGRVIEAFGNFVVGGNYAVGLVAFLIIAIINFVVITKGAGRIAEVAARFTLDAMPGRQMSIDADLNAGLIDEVEARKRREEISLQADFYGAMDGASKFVRGDAVAGLIITGINILGGFVVGMAQKGMSVSGALKTFTLLTIGDGLVAQIPAIIVSTAAGIIVTRAAAEADLGKELTKQVFLKPRALAIASGILFALGLVPGLPAPPFLLVAGLVGITSYVVTRYGPPEEGEEGLEEEQADKEAPLALETLIQVDPLELEIGYGLIPLVDESKSRNLLDRISSIRKQVAVDLGLVVPPIRIRDNIRLGANEYAIKIKGVEVVSGEVLPDQLLAMNAGGAEGELKGLDTKEPVFGLPAVWVGPEEKKNAELAGYTVVEPAAVIVTHLGEVLKDHAPEILGRQEVQKILDSVKQEHPAVVEELLPEHLTLGGVHKVLQRLLEEKVPIRDMVTILETLADYAPSVKDPDALAEFVRQALGRAITKQYADEKGVLSAITLDPGLERALSESIVKAEDGAQLVVSPVVAEEFFQKLSEAVRAALSATERAILLCSQQLRLHLRRLTKSSFPHLAVLSYNEAASAKSIKVFATVRVSDASNALLSGDNN